MRPWKLLPWIALMAVFAGGRTARAKEGFPGQIARDLGAVSDPPCSLCHQYGKTGKDTLVTPFALAMRARGMTGGGSSLDDALARLEADGVDSDGDGATDVEEIVAGSDPNSAASAPTKPGTVRDPQLGCAVAGRAEGGPEPLAAVFAVVFAVAVVVVSTRCRRRRRSPPPVGS